MPANATLACEPPPSAASSDAESARVVGPPPSFAACDPLPPITFFVEPAPYLASSAAFCDSSRPSAISAKLSVASISSCARERGRHHAGRADTCAIVPSLPTQAETLRDELKVVGRGEGYLCLGQS